jgi:hypothetical protein
MNGNEILSGGDVITVVHVDFAAFYTSHSVEIVTISEVSEGLFNSLFRHGRRMQRIPLAC